MSESVAKETVKASRTRSPNYPSMDLAAALAKAKQLFDRYKMVGVAYPLACGHLGYKPDSSTAAQCIAALKAYGLVTVGGGIGPERIITISPAGERIIRNAPDRASLLKVAALAPSINQEVWDRYKAAGELPPDEILHRYLVWDREEGSKFNQDSVDTFIARLKATLDFAGITADGIIEEEEPGLSDSDETERQAPKPGDYVTWAPQGIEKFATPQKVLGVSDDGLFAFVTGTQTGIPMAELAVVEPPKRSDAKPPLSPFANTGRADEEPEAPGQTRERLTLDEGDVVLEWPRELSQDSVTDLEAWLAVLVNRARRKAGIKKPEPKRTGTPVIEL